MCHYQIVIFMRKFLFGIIDRLVLYKQYNFIRNEQYVSSCYILISAPSPVHLSGTGVKYLSIASMNRLR